MQGCRRTLLLALVAFAFMQAESVWAATRGGGGAGGSSAGSGSRASHSGGHRHGGGRHHSGGHHHGSHSHWSFGFAFGGPWWYPSYSYPASYYYPDPYYYPPPAYYPPPTYYVPPPQTVYSSEPDGYWHYCPASKSFYPYVTECAGGQWERVEPRPPPPGSDNVRTYSSP
jgi:hypothetical protein